MGFHFIHRYNKPIASMYAGFNTRDIVYGCKCGKRIIKKIRRPFDVDFPIPTTILITSKELEQIKNNK